jgi:hypothetical protein
VVDGFDWACSRLYRLNEDNVKCKPWDKLKAEHQRCDVGDLFFFVCFDNVGNFSKEESLGLASRK